MIANSCQSVPVAISNDGVMGGCRKVADVALDFGSQPGQVEQASQLRGVHLRFPAQLALSEAGIGFKPGL